MAHQSEAQIDGGVAIEGSMKSCCRCKTLKTLSDFGRCKSRSDGLYPTCKPCRTKMRADAANDPAKRARKMEYEAAFHARHPGKAKKYAEKWRGSNRDLARSRSDAWKTRNSDRQRSAEIAYRANNPEKRKASIAAYRLANREKEKEYSAKWARANRDKVCARAARRRAAVLVATPQWAIESEILAIYTEAQRVTRETGIAHHVDHIVPLKSQIVCGLHCPANLRVIPGIENLSKGNRLWPDKP